jgi:1-acyl-sn-glycerol-3-phosphate acyltransferase
MPPIVDTAEPRRHAAHHPAHPCAALARRTLDDGGLLCILPEGGITRDGTLQPFKGGIMKILETHPVPVVPLALQNLWAPYISRIEGGHAMVKLFRRGCFTRVGLVPGLSVPATSLGAEHLQHRVEQLLAA